MTRITEPHWGRPGHVKPDGSLATPFADVIRALVKRVFDSEETIEEVQATQTEQAAQITNISTSVTNIQNTVNNITNNTTTTTVSSARSFLLMGA